MGDGTGGWDLKFLQMLKENAQVVAFIETVKEFGRYALSFFIGWLLDNAYVFFAKSKLSPDVVLAIGAAIRAADYYWHRYNKTMQPEEKGQSMGLFGF